MDIEMLSLYDDSDIEGLAHWNEKLFIDKNNIVYCVLIGVCPPDSGYIYG